MPNVKKQVWDDLHKEIATHEQKILVLSEDNAKLKRQLNDAYRENSNFEELVALLPDHLEPFRPPTPRVVKKRKGAIKEDVVLHLSDIHGDLVVKPQQVNNLEEFNLSVVYQRAEVLINSVLKWCVETMHNFEFETLWIFLNGDLVEGEIHPSNKDHGQILPAAMAIAKLLAVMFRDLSQYFPQIKVICTSGNHGRMTKKKDYEGAMDNWDFLVSNMTKILCSEIPNIEFTIPDSYSIIVDIKGHNYYVAHGDDVKSWSGIPWYGLQRETMRLTALTSVDRQRISYYCYGHFHQMGTFQQQGAEMIMNGAWPATTPYIFNAHKGYTPPTQLLHGANQTYGMTWRLPINLCQEFEPGYEPRYIYQGE